MTVVGHRTTVMTGYERDEGMTTKGAQTMKQGFVVWALGSRRVISAAHLERLAHLFSSILYIICYVNVIMETCSRNL
jgi:hypothetical protein